jgi:phosphatidate cytidylyltransferase
LVALRTRVIKMVARVITAAVGIPAIVMLSLQGGWPFCLFVLALAEGGLVEYYRLTLVPGLFCSWGYLVSALLIIGTFVHGLEYSWLLFTGGLVGLLMVVLFGFPQYNFQQAGTALLGACYIPLFFSYLLLLRALPQGEWFVLLAFVLTWTADSAAFLVGSYFGHYKLAPKLSPHKTWAGAGAGLVSSVVVMLLLAPKLGLGWFQGATIGALVGLAAMLGDLLESALKRLAQVKDAGSILPGHGGILDRFDALLLVAPTLYFFLRLVWGGGL